MPKLLLHYVAPSCLGFIGFFCSLFLFLSFCTSCKAQAGLPVLREVYADPSEGVDLGTAIGIADKRLGSGCGRIVVPSGIKDAHVTVSPKLSECRTLELRSPITWDVHLVLANRDTLMGTGAEAMQTLPTGIWIDGSNLSNVEVANLWIESSSPQRQVENQMFRCRTCANISVHGVHSRGATILACGSTADSYANVRQNNLSHDIDVSDNDLDGEGTPSEVFVFYYTQHARADRNVSRNARFIGFWAGGDAAVEGRNPANQRWASDITVTNSSGYNLEVFVWGSMGHDIAVSNITGSVCRDVGLDAEGSDRVTFSSFSVADCRNGNIAVFFGSHDIDFGPGKSTCSHAVDSAGKPVCELAHFKNDSQDPTVSQRIHVHDIDFVNLDASVFAPIYYEPVGDLEFVHNTSKDAVLLPTAGALSGFRLQANTMTLTRALTASAMPPGVPVQYPALVSVVIQGSVSTASWIEGNTFISTVPQPADSYAVYARDADFNHSDTVSIDHNTTTGFASDVRVEAASQNPGITPVFRFTQNKFGGHSVLKKTLGRNGSFPDDGSR
jgi:hypothetical protein